MSGRTKTESFDVVGVLLAPVCLACLGACGAPAAPVEFLDLRVEEITATRAVVRARTTQPATCGVDVGRAPDRLDRTYADPTMVSGELREDHFVALENLAAETTFYYQAWATNAAGKTFRSTIGAFTTPRGDPVSALPNVALRSAGASVVSVSSNWGARSNDSEYGADRAFDDDFSTEWATNGDGDGAFVEIDLGQPRALTHFGFRSRIMSDDMGGTSSSVILSVTLTLDGAGPLGPFDTSDPTRLYVYPLPSGTQARRARVSAATTNGGNTGAKEIQLLSP